MVYKPLVNYGYPKLFKCVLYVEVFFQKIRIVQMELDSTGL